jgi:hypothetical protein
VARTRPRPRAAPHGLRRVPTAQPRSGEADRRFGESHRRDSSLRAGGDEGRARVGPLGEGASTIVIPRGSRVVAIARVKDRRGG